MTRMVPASTSAISSFAISPVKLLAPAGEFDDHVVDGAELIERFARFACSAGHWSPFRCGHRRFGTYCTAKVARSSASDSWDQLVGSYSLMEISVASSQATAAVVRSLTR